MSNAFGTDSYFYRLLFAFSDLPPFFLLFCFSLVLVFFRFWFFYNFTNIEKWIHPISTLIHIHFDLCVNFLKRKEKKDNLCSLLKLKAIRSLLCKKTISFSFQLLHSFWWWSIPDFIYFLSFPVCTQTGFKYQSCL